MDPKLKRMLLPQVIARHKELRHLVGGDIYREFDVCGMCKGKISRLDIIPEASPMLQFLVRSAKP